MGVRGFLPSPLLFLHMFKSHFPALQLMLSPKLLVSVLAFSFLNCLSRRKINKLIKLTNKYTYTTTYLRISAREYITPEKYIYYANRYYQIMHVYNVSSNGYFHGLSFVRQLYLPLQMDPQQDSMAPEQGKQESRVF